MTSIGRRFITLWRIPDGTKLASYPSEPKPTDPGQNGLAAASDSGLAAYGTESGQVRVIDLHDGKELWSAVASKLLVTALAFSPDGKMLASAAGYSEADIRLWDVATGKEIGRLEGHKSWVGSLVFWPDGKRLASASADQTIRTWDVARRQCLDVLRGHLLEVWRLALLPDGKTLVSGAKDGTVCLWDTSVTHPHQPRSELPEPVVAWGFAPDSQSVLTLNQQGQTAQWHGAAFQQKESLLNVGTNFAGPPLFSRDSRFLAMGAAQGTLSVWDLSRRVLRREFKPGDGGVYPLRFLARGNRLVVWVAADDHFSEWDLEANREIQSWSAPPMLTDFGVSPDERLGIGVGWRGGVSARNLSEHTNTNLPLNALEGWFVDFSPDGARLAIASSLGHARVWDTGTWREEATLRGFLNGVVSVAFSPDGKRLATGGSNPDDALKLWDVASWQELITLETPGGFSEPTAFSPDGNTIGTLNRDNGTLNLWRAPSWAEITAAEAREKAEIKQP